MVLIILIQRSIYKKIEKINLNLINPILLQPQYKDLLDNYLLYLIEELYASAPVKSRTPTFSLQRYKTK